MEPYKFTAEPAPAAQSPFITGKNSVSLQPLRPGLPLRYSSPIVGSGRTSDGDVSGRMLLLRACVMACPVKGAIRLEHPLMNRAKFIPTGNN